MKKKKCYSQYFDNSAELRQVVRNDLGANVNSRMSGPS